MYIDGVFSGGGMKGLALIGACHAIEKRGYRFKRLAGTSAGSIIAALIAAGYSSTEIFRVVEEISLEKFMDARKTLLPYPFSKWILLYWKLGLYKGKEFEEWLKEKLEVKGLKTFGDLPRQSLKVIASDLTNGRLMVIPDDLEQYGVDAQSFPVAKAVRMSCSLPYFFEPVRLKSGHVQTIIVDGGVLSNFPMWVFDGEEGKKQRPVLGIKLSHKMNEQPKKNIKNAIQMFAALFETMKDAHDARYISRRHEKNIIFIPTEGIVSTEFNLSEKKKRLLYELGYQRAEQFLATWSY